MAIGLVEKLASFSFALATTATGSVFLHNSLIPKTIGEELTKEGFELLPDNSNEWNNLNNKHKNASKEGEQEVPKKIKDLNSPSNEKDLKEACKILWNKKISEITKEDKERIKQEIKDWCVTKSVASTIKEA